MPKSTCILTENLLEEFLTRLRNQHGGAELVKEIREFILHQDAIEKWKQMSNYIKDKQKNSQFSKRSDDPEWFADLSTNAQTKEEFLNKGCQSRIRGYLSKAESGLKSELTDITKLNDIVLTFKALLKQNQYNGHYFDRASVKSDKICDKLGNFGCEGRFDQDSCNYSDVDHSINPYDSAESRILFSTWNLDHV